MKTSNSEGSVSGSSSCGLNCAKPLRLSVTFTGASGGSKTTVGEDDEGAVDKDGACAGALDGAGTGARAGAADGEGTG